MRAVEMLIEVATVKRHLDGLDCMFDQKLLPAKLTVWLISLKAYYKMTRSSYNTFQNNIEQRMQKIDKFQDKIIRTGKICFIVHLFFIGIVEKRAILQAAL